MKVELDEPLPDVGIPKIFTEPAIRNWIQLRHSSASPREVDRQNAEQGPTRTLACEERADLDAASVPLSSDHLLTHHQPVGDRLLGAKGLAGRTDPDLETMGAINRGAD